MSDHSCCSCVFARYEVDETDDGTCVYCSKGYNITPEMLSDKPCQEYTKRTIRWGMRTEYRK